jgi:glycosyltransferase involved in cell wall biosynthesis
MAEYLDIEPAQIEIIPHGLTLAGHGSRSASNAGARTIGYFARVCHDKGLHQLVKAFRLLCEDPDLPPLRLRAGGYLGAGDRDYMQSIQQRVHALGLSDRFEYIGEPDRAGKIAFMQSLDVFCLPTIYRESKGLPVLEAWANAVPAVLPAHGTFPELIADTGGGLLYPPGDTTALVVALKKLLLQPALADELGRRGQAGVHDRYTAELMAQRTLDYYHRVLDGQVASDPKTARQFLSG